MNCFHYTPGYLSLSRKNLSWHKNNFHSFPHISLLSTLALLKNWGIVFLPAAPRPAFSSNHTPQSVGRKLTTLRERSVRIREVVGSNPIRSTIRSTVILIELRWIFLLLRRQLSAKMKYAYARIIRAPVHRRKRLEQIALEGKKANVLSRIIC